MYSIYLSHSTYAISPSDAVDGSFWYHSIFFFSAVFTLQKFPLDIVENDSKLYSLDGKKPSSYEIFRMKYFVRNSNWR